VIGLPVSAAALAAVAGVAAARSLVLVARSGPPSALSVARETPATFSSRRRLGPRGRRRTVTLWVLACLPTLLLPWPAPLIGPFVALVVAGGMRLVASRRRARHRLQIDAEVPQLLDLLAAGSSAGLAAPLALARAVDGVRGPLADELRGVIDAVDLGARWRDELRELADRLELPDLRSAVAVLTRTERLGASLQDATVELAATVRQGRRAAVTERARAAPVKMLFPLVFLVLPAFLLLTVVPVLLTTVQSIR
jgi:pilus assembly protein TadC